MSRPVDSHRTAGVDAEHANAREAVTSPARQRCRVAVARVAALALPAHS